MCDCNAWEIKNLKDQARSTDYREMYVKMRKANSELRKERDNTKAELSVVWSNLADAAAALDTYRKMRVKMDNAIFTLTEERDLSRELFQGMVSEYADLLARYEKSCDDYEKLASRFIWRNDAD